jgi:hypothetical protein
VKPGRSAVLLAALFLASTALADDTGLPWSEGAGVPLPEGVRSILPLREDTPIESAPRGDATRRGSAAAGARLPLYAARRGPGCEGRWLMVGPHAWVCQAGVELSDAPPLGARETPKDEPDGLPFAYFFVGRDGSAAYGRFELADDAEPEMELQPGFGVAIVEQRVRPGSGAAYGRTHHGQWVPMRDLVPVRPFAFHGEDIKDGVLDVGWVLDDRTVVYAKPDGATRASGTRARFEVVHVLEEQGKGDRTMFRVGEGQWLRAKDVRRPHRSAPPKEVLKGERWIDVELGQQTLVAYEGERPVFATMVSTGKGAQGTERATPIGVHRIWVKLRSSTMDNLEDERATSNYAIEDVPYVQFFSKGVALHGAFWHHGFGRVRSHGCVNLAPLDAQRVFAFTGPKLPAGWTASLPSEVEAGSVVQVRP